MKVEWKYYFLKADYQSVCAVSSSMCNHHRNRAIHLRTLLCYLPACLLSMSRVVQSVVAHGV